MTMTHFTGTGILRELIAAPELRSLEHLHLASLSAPVREAVLVSDIEDVGSVRPDTLIVLGSGAARGGWMISAALRYAWERRACGLVVPAGSTSPTVVELAGRLGISLFTFDGEMTAIALAVAVQIGVARAGTLGRLRAFSLRLGEITEVRDALALISRELEGAPVQLRTAGPVSMNVRSAPDPESELPGVEAQREEVDVPLGAEHSDVLVAAVSASARDSAREVLQAAAPTVRALLADSRLSAIRASLPIMSIVSAEGSGHADDLGTPLPDPAGLRLGWPIHGGFCAVCLRTPDKERIGNAVHRTWNESFADVPLAEFADGWLAFVPVTDESGVARLTTRVVENCSRLRPHPFTLGISTHRIDPNQAAVSAREAWHAARMGSIDGDPESAVVSFASLLPHLPGRLIDPTLARSIAEQLYPALLSDSQSVQLSEAVVALLDHHGSATAAAAALGVHRNTLQSRLRRATELGIELQDPSVTLAIHLVLSGLQLAPRAEG